MKGMKGMKKALFTFNHYSISLFDKW